MTKFRIGTKVRLLHTGYVGTIFARGDAWDWKVRMNGAPDSVWLLNSHELERVFVAPKKPYQRVDAGPRHM